VRLCQCENKEKHNNTGVGVLCIAQQNKQRHNTKTTWGGGKDGRSYIGRRKGGGSCSSYSRYGIDSKRNGSTMESEREREREGESKPEHSNPTQADRVGWGRSLFVIMFVGPGPWMFCHE